MRTDWANEILKWLYPPRCPVCGNVTYAGKTMGLLTVCPGCQKVFHRVLPPVCCRCGRPVEREEEFCFNCRGKQFSYVRGYPVWIYNAAMRKSIAAFKYHGRREYARYYGQEFVRMYGGQLKRFPVQALIPVPLFSAKQKSRGYNQAELFAEEIGYRLGIPVYNDYLLRVRNTVPQKELNDKQRYVNLRKAFTVNKKKRKYYAGVKSIMLVDDIYTTGTTIEACTRVLLQAGVEKVYFASVSIGS